MNRRWMVKKVARGAVTLGTWGSGATWARRTIAGTRVRVLTYHGVGERHPEDPFTVDRHAFDAQMGLLARERRAISLDELRTFVAGRPSNVPADGCLVTVDDGLLSMLTEILPTLRRWNVPAVAFVTAALIGTEHPDAPAPYMSWDELRELAADPLITIGSHANTHRSLGLMSDTEARDEAIRSRERLEDELGIPIRTFAYPFGTRADFGATTDRVLADAGYTMAFNSMHGAIRAGDDPISLPRVKVEGGEGLPLFSMISRGAMDPWRVVDANLHHLQRVRTEVF